MDKQNFNVIMWSGGADSTATIILAHELGIKIDLILMSLVWFDRERGILGENKEHIDWVMNYAKPVFESWGYPVEFVWSEKDYLYYFYQIRQTSRYADRIGKIQGFPIGGSCRIQRLKVEPIAKKLRELRKIYNITEFCGIRADEPERIAKMKKRGGQRSLLEEKGMTRFGVMWKCKSYGLLSPNYREGCCIRGCWFCPNCSIAGFAKLKQCEPEKWRELAILAKEKNTVSEGFKYGKTFEEIDALVDAFLADPPSAQLSIFDMDWNGGDTS